MRKKRDSFLGWVTFFHQEAHTIWLRNWMDFEDIPFRSQVVRKTEVKDDSNIWARAIGRTELPADSWVCGSEAQKNVAFHLFKTFELGTGNAGVGKTNNPWSFLWGSQKLNNYSCSKWGEELSGAMRTSNETWPSLEVQGKLSRENNFWINIWKMNNSKGERVSRLEGIACAKVLLEGTQCIGKPMVARVRERWIWDENEGQDPYLAGPTRSC